MFYWALLYHNCLLNGYGILRSLGQDFFPLDSLWYNIGMGGIKMKAKKIGRLRLLFIITLLAVVFSGCGNQAEMSTAEDNSAVSESEGSADEYPLTGVVVCIDPGHGITSEGGEEPIAPGSSETRKKHSTGTEGQYQTEEELNLTVGLMVQDLLIDKGATVVMTRTTHECDLSNIDRAVFAKEEGADLTLRIHTDGSENTGIKGISVLVPSPTFITDESLLDRSVVFGQLLLSSVVEATGAENRGIVERSDLTGFNWTEVPVALVEMGFMTNAEEDAQLAKAEYQQLLATAMADAVEEFFEIYPITK